MLKRFDLKNTVLPKISIDEFEPKTGKVEEVIVVAFYTIDQDPANDLSEFLDKSFLPILDVEPSPNPNDKGEFLVFVEFRRNTNFNNVFESLIAEVENLTNEMRWKVMPYLAKHTYDFKSGEWARFVIVEPSKYVSRKEFLLGMRDGINIQAKDFFKNEEIKVDENKSSISLTRGNRTIVLEKYYYEKESILSEDEKFTSTPMIFEGNYDVSVLSGLLGPNWLVIQHGQNLIIKENNNDIILYATFQ